MNHLEFDTERLEQRRMLAGDVSVELANGDLRINGDNQANVVLMEIEGSGYVFEGIETTINGSSAEFRVDRSKVTDDVLINLRGGDNVLVATGLNVPDDLRIRGGNGRNSIYVAPRNEFAPERVGDDVSIRTGGGNDSVTLLLDVTGDARIATGSGNDLVQFNKNDLGRAFVNTGSGGDGVIMNRNEIGDLRLSLGGGDDEVLTEFVDATEARIVGAGGDDLWFDNDSPGGPDLFSVAEARSITGDELEDLTDRRNDLITRLAD